MKCNITGKSQLKANQSLGFTKLGAVREENIGGNAPQIEAPKAPVASSKGGRIEALSAVR